MKKTELNRILAKRFWEMSEQEADQVVNKIGLNAWRSKILEDKKHAREELSRGPNPWVPGNFSEKRQRIIQSLVPDLAEEMKKKAAH